MPRRTGAAVPARGVAVLSSLGLNATGHWRLAPPGFGGDCGPCVGRRRLTVRSTGVRPCPAGAESSDGGRRRSGRDDRDDGGAWYATLSSPLAPRAYPASTGECGG
ncbi:hypothetical protein GCM10018793_49570 [Streptomyces sulfonofaciens]|uniref:Uncharacterized protein n=1 Tax=Streptomyces sulfonofaciens TaxID=68272 RepID=A0A919L4H0_9ACTN|nr:hypothetical protein GCM10018793_49570 [Streptomyces sulfonofaciens]